MSLWALIQPGFLPQGLRSVGESEWALVHTSRF